MLDFAAKDKQSRTAVKVWARCGWRVGARCFPREEEVGPLPAGLLLLKMGFPCLLIGPREGTPTQGKVGGGPDRAGSPAQLRPWHDLRREQVARAEG